MRILRSYDAGESVTIEILRKQRRTTLTWTVPEEERRWRRPRTVRPPGEQSLWRDHRGDLERALRAAQRSIERSQRMMEDALRRSLDQRREVIRARLEDLRGRQSTAL
jgi:hypothetical protein